MLNTQLSILAPQRPDSIFDALELYRQALTAGEVEGSFSMAKTALLRYTVPLWGGPETQEGQQVSPKALEFLKSLPLEKLKTALEVQNTYFKQSGVDSDCQRRNRFHLKKFEDWCRTNGWLNDKSPKKKKAYSFNRAKGQGRIVIQAVRSTSLNRPEFFGLGTQDDDYREDEAGNRVLANPELEKQLSELAEYVGNISERSAERAVQYAKRMLAWLHREKGVPLEKLELGLLIPFVQLRFSDEDFQDHPDFVKKNNRYLYPEKVHQKLSVIEGLALREAKAAAQKALKQLDGYFRWWDASHKASGKEEGVAPASKRSYVDALINIAKFIYQDQTDVAEAKDFDDISVIRQLKNKRNSIKLDPRQTAERILKRTVPWPVAVQVFEKQRKKANAYKKGARNPRCKNNIAFRNRPQESIATDMQKVVCLGLMTFIPTDRQQTYCNLKQGNEAEHSLKKGVFLGEGYTTFIPANQMKDSSSAFWWINLNDFKTDETYGEFWYPVPNIQFVDGTTFYEYLEGWLFGFEDKEGKWPIYYKGKDRNWQGCITPDGKRCGWKEALKPTHDFVFTKPRTGTQYEDTDFCGLIKGIFIRFTQDDGGKPIPVTPHSFRHMLASYLDSIDVSEKERKSISYCMHHSLETHMTQYTHRENMNMIGPAVRLMNKLNQKLLKGTRN